MKELLLAKKLFSYTSPHSCSQTFECSLTLSFHSLLFLRVSLNKKTQTGISAKENGFKTYSNDQNITDNGQRIQRTKFEAWSNNAGLISLFVKTSPCFKIYTDLSATSSKKTFEFHHLRLFGTFFGEERMNGAATCCCENCITDIEEKIYRHYLINNNIYVLRF